MRPGTGRACGRSGSLGSPEIRRLSRQAGLFTWDKPAYACLATRIKTGEAITQERLETIERSEEKLFAMGFTDFRVRTAGRGALLQFPGEQLPRACARFGEIQAALNDDFDRIHIDPQGRRTGL